MIKKQIEIELRSLMDKSEYQRLKKTLDKKSEDLGQDNKDVYFFLLPDKIVKAVNNESKGTAEIVMKLNRLGRGSSDFEELEIEINPKDFEKAVKFFSNLDFNQKQRSYQKRRNYIYKGVEIALKHTDSWGYHAELEILVSSKKEQEKAENEIRKVAKELGIEIMTEEEISKFAQKIDKNYDQGKYQKQILVSGKKNLKRT